MRSGNPEHLRRKESGFSMIEMLITAFVLAIGILGLTMLQAMSMRVATGSRNLGIAVQLTEQMMDQVELEGRLTYNNTAPGNQYANPTALTGLQYVGVAAVNKYFNIDSTTGNAVEVLASDNPLFHLKMTQAVAAGVGVSDVTVSVEFTDAINPATNLPIKRTATLTRRILHA